MTADGLMKTQASINKQFTANYKERCPYTDIAFISLKLSFEFDI